ncbi:unnamed protein product [Orchesella dallaii]|uniref:Uncharacterized protein n=1 Tax=Orchesella dallaii TaxID=48710 RepID=A0ABP1REF1_9HEXA
MRQTTKHNATTEAKKEREKNGRMKMKKPQTTHLTPQKEMSGVEWAMTSKDVLQQQKNCLRNLDDALNRNKKMEWRE